MHSIYALAWRNLNNNRMRTFLSVVAVILGVATTLAGNVVIQSVRRALLTSQEMRTIVEGTMSQIDIMMSLIGVVVMLAAGFLIFNAFAMSVTQRQQQIGALRSLGMTRGQVMRVLLVEALIVAVIGTLLGLLTGPLLGKAIVAFMQQFGGGTLAFADADPSADSIVLGLILGLGVTVLAMLAPARRAAHITPLEALRQSQAEGVQNASRWGTIIGLILVIGLALHVILAPPGAWVQYPQDSILTGLFVLVWLVGLVLLLPAIIGLTGRITRRLTQSSGAVGRLIAENLQRGRGRVTLTVLALAFSLTIVTGLVGFINFFLDGLVIPTMQPAMEYGGWFIARMDVAGGWDAISKLDLDSVLVSDDEIAAIQAAVEGHGRIIPNYYVVVPELSLLGNSFFSFMMDPDVGSQYGDAGFNFTEGDWDSALPIMKAGCGVLVTPLVARKNNAALGDTLSVTGPDGPVACTIAGIGSTSVGASIISMAVRDQFNITNPVMVIVVALPGHSFDEVQADLDKLTEAYPTLYVNRFQKMVDMMDDVSAALSLAFDGLLILAIFAAALGVVNTMMMSVGERSREIGLLRAVGTTRSQTRRLIMGEATLMGLIGGLMGLFTGRGLILVVVVTYGGNSFGLKLDLWPLAIDMARIALPTGIVGVIAAPIIAALAAWPPMRGILRENPVETLALR